MGNNGEKGKNKSVLANLKKPSDLFVVFSIKRNIGSEITKITKIHPNWKNRASN